MGFLLLHRRGRRRCCSHRHGLVGCTDAGGCGNSGRKHAARTCPAGAGVVVGAGAVDVGVLAALVVVAAAAAVKPTTRTLTGEREKDRGTSTPPRCVSSPAPFLLSGRGAEQQRQGTTEDEEKTGAYWHCFRLPNQGGSRLSLLHRLPLLPQIYSRAANWTMRK